MSKIFKSNSFLVLGRAGIDLYADPPGAKVEEAGRFTSALGGSAANIAAGVSRLGSKASLVTVLSDDAVGRFVRRELEPMALAQHMPWWPGANAAPRSPSSRRGSRTASR